MSKLPDPFREGLARGWKVTHGEQSLPEQITCDVAIIGSGAGAGITAELLAKAGLDVVLIEEGPLKTSSDFNQKESEAYASLYQEGITRKTLDKGISLLQGRCVGGTTVVNWTSSFRTPPTTLKYWQEHFGLADYQVDTLAPWFKQAEQRLNMAPWEGAPNANNELLRTGATKLGIEAHVIPRNVKGCFNLGSCGLGCPVNAKQSMLVTTIPAALDAGARLFHHTRVEKIDISNDQVTGLRCLGVTPNGTAVPGKAMRVVAKHYVLSGGAINSPAVLLRSNAPDPHNLVGKRTFLHPVVFSSAVYAQKIEGWAGAPQSIYSDHFLYTQPIDGPVGYKLEATPIHPGLMAYMLGGVGSTFATRLAHYPHTQMLLALIRDGFHEQSVGGQVILKPDGFPALHYPVSEYLQDGFRRALTSMAEIQFAAGAQQVLAAHEQAHYVKTFAEAKAAIAQFDMRNYMTAVGSAHIMGGCRIGQTEQQGVVQPDGTHWQVKNLSVHDGSVFPTSIGANPQLSIYGIVNRMATLLAKRLSGKDVALA
ncbi:MAG: GMC family oxidoreductase [Rubrivivax sp.]|nr:MAG: GMC family oxidoreductase [Rubrivivax sp.]